MYTKAIVCPPKPPVLGTPDPLAASLREAIAKLWEIKAGYAQGQVSQRELSSAIAKTTQVKQMVGHIIEYRKKMQETTSELESAWQDLLEVAACTVLP